MRYLGGAAMVLLLSAAVSPVCAAAEEFSGFYALGTLGVRPKAGPLKPLSDEKLAAIEGSARFPGLPNNMSFNSRRDHVRDLMHQYLAYRLLSELFHGGIVTSLVNQNNFVIQLNIAVGNNITQINNATQRNAVIMIQRAH